MWIVALLDGWSAGVYAVFFPNVINTEASQGSTSSLVMVLILVT